jgi:hypothetical protein
MWTYDNFLKDLKTLNRKIRKHEIPVKKNKLIKLESDLESSANKDISHTISEVEFTLNESISGTVPIEVNSFCFFLSLNFILNNALDFEKQDPFFNDKINYKDAEIDAYTLQIEINGMSLDLNQEFYNWWHLDRHITGGGASKVVHPFYHFQNGGNGMKEYNNHIKVAVFTGAPRLPHPPMDIFLAFHFVITNFYNKNSFSNIADLLEDDEYIEIIENAQKRMWKPYYAAFNGGTHTHYSIPNITPLYTVH